MHLTRLWFTRHGEPMHPDRWTGRTEDDLSPLGRHQAEALAAYLEEAEVDAIVTSPRKRALDTIAPLARQRGMKLEVRKDWAEMDFGAWEGLTWPEIEARDSAFAERWLRETATLACPGGESADGFEERVRSALAGLLDEFAGRTVVLSGHAGTCRVVLASVLGLRYLEAFRFVQDFGCLNACALGPGSASVALVNLVPGPRSVQAPS